MKEIKLPGFTSTIKADDALAISVFGEHGCGKTRFAITAPDPIGFVPLDRKARKTVELTAKALHKTVLMPTADFIRVENPLKLAIMEEKAAREYYRRHVDAVKEAAFKLYGHPDIRTVVIDTGTQLWEDILFANYGRNQRVMPRDRGPANQEMMDLLNVLSGKNLIITHKAAEIWRNDKPTGKFRASGFPHIGYSVNAEILLECDEDNEPDEDGTYAGYFKLFVHHCQANPMIQNKANPLLEDDMITFPGLANYIYPDSDLEDWT